MQEVFIHEIFSKKAILRQEKAQTDFRLYNEVCKIMIESLADSFFIYGKNPESALNLNEKQALKGLPKTKGVKFFETNLNEIKERFPLILAPLFLHKASNINQTLNEIKNLLTESGIFTGTFFGLSNLEELGMLLASEDIKICGQPMQRLLPLIDIKTIGMMLQNNGFKNITVQSETISFEFESLKSALYFLKNSGEGNVLSLREKSFISGNILKKYIAEYQKSFTLKFEVCFFLCHI